MGVSPFQDAHLLFLALGLRRARGQVQADHRELAVARLEIAALGVEGRVAEPIEDGVGLARQVEADAAVAGLAGRIEHDAPAFRMGIRMRVELLAGDARLLQADDIGA